MDVMARRRAIMAHIARLVKKIISSVTGLVSFKTNMEEPMKVTCEFSPVQDLHGYSTPWPAGGSKNKWNPDTSVSGYLNATTGKIVEAGSTTKEITSDYIEVPSGTTIISAGYNYNVAVKWGAVALFDENKEFIARPVIENVLIDTVDISGYSNVAFCRACYRSYGNGNQYGYVAFGNDTSFVPYENICPISGWTGCEIGHAKKNLFDKTAVTITTQHCINYTTGGITGLSTSRQGYTSFVPIKGDTTYTISGISFGTGANIGHAFYSSNDASTYISGVNKNSTGYTTFTTPSDAKYARFSIIVPSGSSAASQIDVIQLELGSSATTYEAYQGSAKTINWQSSAGTVYGGTLTLNEDGSADVVAKWIYGTPNYSALGSKTFFGGGYRNAYNYMGVGALAGFPQSVNHAKIISDKAVRGDFSATNTNPVVMKTASNYIYFGVKSELLESDDLAGLRAYLVEHAPAICYPLKQQDYIVYHFDSIGQLQSFLGNNAVWHDMNGQITVEYYNYQ